MAQETSVAREPARYSVPLIYATVSAVRIAASEHLFVQSGPRPALLTAKGLDHDGCTWAL